MITTHKKKILKKNESVKYRKDSKRLKLEVMTKSLRLRPSVSQTLNSSFYDKKQRNSRRLSDSNNLLKDKLTQINK